MEFGRPFEGLGRCVRRNFRFSQHGRLDVKERERCCRSNWN
jgi:hypothetical protein